MQETGSQGMGGTLTWMRAVYQYGLQWYEILYTINDCRRRQRVVKWFFGALEKVNVYVDTLTEGDDLTDGKE